MKMPYRQFDQTSDIGIEITAESLEDVYVKSVLCLADLITDIDEIKPKIVKQLEIQADDKEILLKELLSEILYLFHSKYFIPIEVNVIRLDENYLSTILKGDFIDPQIHSIKREIKAITYHRLAITKLKNGFKTSFVLDI